MLVKYNTLNVFIALNKSNFFKFDFNKLRCLDAHPCSFIVRKRTVFDTFNPHGTIPPALHTLQYQSFDLIANTPTTNSGKIKYEISFSYKTYVYDLLYLYRIVIVYDTFS